MSTLIAGQAALSVRRTSVDTVRVSAEPLRELVREAIEKTASPELEEHAADLRRVLRMMFYGSLEYSPVELETLRSDLIDGVAAEICPDLFITTNQAMALGQMLIEAATGESPALTSYAGARRREPVGATR